MKRTAIAAAALTCSCGLASGQTIMNEGFEAGAGDWLMNGQPNLFPDGNPGQCIGLPYGDFWGVTLRNETAGSPLTGDLTRHGGPIELKADFNVLTLHNWIPEPMDPGQFPLVLEFVDYPAPGSSDPIVSVYTTGPGLPPTGTWGTFTYPVPDPTQAALPPGWGGTGDEDPVTLEPILPANRTYTSVMRNVDEVRFTTMRPGYFYVSSFWEVRADNVIATADGGGCYPDCDGDSTLTLADFGCFQTKFALGDPYADCNGDAALNLADFGCFQTGFAVGCP